MNKLGRRKDSETKVTTAKGKHLQTKSDGTTEKKQRLKTEQRRWRKLTGKEKLILILPAAAVIIAVVVILLLNKSAMTYEMKGTPCQYYAGNAYMIDEGATMTRTNEDKTMMESVNGYKHYLDSLPIYYEDRPEMTLAEDMVFYAPRSGNYGRLEYFTDLQYVERGNIVNASRDQKTTMQLEHGFIYDGGDFYVFLEPVILSFNGYRMELPTFSYVQAIYSGDIMVFNYAAKEFLIEAPRGDVVASVVGGDYKISLLGDYMTTSDGTKILLFTRPELLDPVMD